MAISAPNNFHKFQIEKKNFNLETTRKGQNLTKVEKKNIYLDVESDPMGNFGLSMKD